MSTKPEAQKQSQTPRKLTIRKSTIKDLDAKSADAVKGGRASARPPYVCA
jgi:hypothetical protein